MKTKIFILIVFLIIIACEKEGKNTPFGTCPKANDPISWENNLKYGSWQVGMSGFDGNYGIPTGGATVINLHSTCNCPFYGKEIGGTGNTYAVFLPDTATIFRWANGRFYEFIVSEKWQGTTEKGIKMGDLLSDFLVKYPYFHPVSYDLTMYVNAEPVYVTAWFTDKNPQIGKLKKIKVNDK